MTSILHPVSLRAAKYGLLSPTADISRRRTVIKFYEDAEAVLSHLKKRGTPMILREIDEDKFKPFSFSGMQKIVQRIRKELKLPVTFTLDACRHGGLTELEEAELTDGQGRALSAHRT